MQVKAEQRILRRMIVLSDSGTGPTGIAATLNAGGLSNPRTGRGWTPGNVGSVLRTARRRET